MDNKTRRHNRRGPSSFHMHNPDIIFSALKIKSGDFFLDLGCGPGDYSLHASKLVGDSGRVYAFDTWENVVDSLKEEITRLNVNNIKVGIADMTQYLPFESSLFDFCLVSTVLHTFDIKKCSDIWCNEIKRILKKNGQLAIIECKKEEQYFGPPLNMKISHQEIETLLIQYGFEKKNYVDLGFNYLITFSLV